MAHWGLLPSQVAELSEDDVEALEYSYLLYERRNVETLSDIIGALTGTSWPIENLLEGAGNPDLLVDKRFTWSLRPPRKRLSSPLTLVVAGNPLLEHLRSQASKLERQDSDNPAILSHPRGMLNKEEKIEIVELGTKSKEEFLSFVRANNLG
jgi:hypothetical protein